MCAGWQCMLCQGSACYQLLALVQSKGRQSGMLDGELVDAISVEELCNDAMPTQSSLPRPTSIAEALSAEV